MHLHPVVGHLMLTIGREFGLRAIRVPTEAGRPRTLGQAALRHWTALLRAQARRAGVRTNDWVMGLHDSGQMTPALVQSLVNDLPQGLTELYFHPAIAQDAIIPPPHAHLPPPGRNSRPCSPPICHPTYG